MIETKDKEWSQYEPQSRCVRSHEIWWAIVTQTGMSQSKTFDYLTSRKYMLSNDI